MKELQNRVYKKYYDESREVVRVELSGLRLLVPRRFVQAMVFQQFEPMTTRMVRRYLKPGMITVDVGAHIGYYTVVAAAAVGPSGLVHALEPCAENFDLLRKNVHLNGFQNVRLHSFAAGEKEGPRTFFLSDATDCQGFFPHPYAVTRGLITVAEKPLDQVVRIAHLVKIDVEGAEIEVLQGMGELLSRSRPLAVCIEWNPACLIAAGHDPCAPLEQLRKMGFHELRVLDDPEYSRRRVEDAATMVRSGNVPPYWRVNLWAVRY